MVSDSVSSFFVYLLLLMIRVVEVMRRVSILELRVVALQSTFSSNNTRIGGPEP